MVDSVDKGFFQGWIRVIEDANGLGTIAYLRDALLDEHILQVRQGIPELLIQRSLEDLLLNAIAGDTLRKVHDVNLGSWKKPFGRFVEKEQANVARLDEFVASLHDVQCRPRSASGILAALE